jgi:4'-phosphopantetheinyl transferase
LIHWLVQSLDDCPEIRRGDATPAWLGAAEQARLAGFKVEKRRRDWLLGRWTAKNLVQRYLAQSAGEAPALDAIFIGADADGAPYAAKGDEQGRLPLSLSISHSQGTAFCGVIEIRRLEIGDWRVDATSQSPISNLQSLTRPSLGCDLELIEPREGNFLDSFFAVEEIEAVQALRELDGMQGDILTTAIWSGKEAVLKALREGLRIDTRRITCRFDLFDAPPQEWSPFTVNVDDELARQYSGAWSAWWRYAQNFVMTCALIT